MIAERVPSSNCGDPFPTDRMQHRPSIPETHQSPALLPRVSTNTFTHSHAPEHRVFSIYSPHRHVYIRQRGHRRPCATMRFPHTTILYNVLRRRELSVNLLDSHGKLLFYSRRSSSTTMTYILICLASCPSLNKAYQPRTLTTIYKLLYPTSYGA
jgi:hypothetical protein